MRRFVAFLLLLLGMWTAGSAALMAANSAGSAGHRDLYIKTANPDGSLNCAKWCGLTEPCC